MEGRRADPRWPGSTPTGTACGSSARRSAPTRTCSAAARRSCRASGWSTPCGSAPTSAHHFEPLDGDLSQPSQRRPPQNTRWRAWQHGRFWVNDADCLVAGPHVERREDWAEVVERYSGLRASSDRLRGLDEWGLETTRRLLRRGLTAPFVP